MAAKEPAAASSFALRLSGKVVTRYDTYADALSAKEWHETTFGPTLGPLTVDLIPTQERPLQVCDGRRDIGD